MSKAQIFDLNDKDIYLKAIKSASEAIQNEGTVVFPTETVYGIGADATSSVAVNKIFSAKGRPADNPLIIHLSDISQIPLYAQDIPIKAMELARKYMPGPLTLVLNLKGGLCVEATAGLQTVAIRIPAFKPALDFIEASNRPIAAPSANISGKPSPTMPLHVIEDMSDKADVILLGGNCSIGLESTVLDCTVEPFSILRPGAVIEVGNDCEELYEKADIPIVFPKAPGMKYRHYKPDCYIVALDLTPEEAIKYIHDLKKIDNQAYFLFDEAMPDSSINTYSLGRYGNAQDGANKLFWALRESDHYGYAKAYIMCPQNGGIGEAFRNRLFKAADEIITKEALE